jgi:hypothetical protein
MRHAAWGIAAWDTTRGAFRKCISRTTRAGAVGAWGMWVPYPPCPWSSNIMGGLPENTHRHVTSPLDMGAAMGHRHTPMGYGPYTLPWPCQGGCPWAAPARGPCSMDRNVLHQWIATYWNNGPWTISSNGPMHYQQWAAGSGHGRGCVGNTHSLTLTYQLPLTLTYQLSPRTKLPTGDGSKPHGGPSSKPTPPPPPVLSGTSSSYWEGGVGRGRNLVAPGAVGQCWCQCCPVR